jgi:hypothetical protein
MQEQNLRQEFLDKFTEEIILAIRGRLEEKQKQNFEEERVKKSIEAEKLKQRFSEYLQKDKIRESSEEERIKKLKENLQPSIQEQQSIQFQPSVQQQPLYNQRILQKKPVFQKPQQEIKIAEKIVMPFHMEVDGDARSIKMAAVSKEISKERFQQQNNEINFGRISELVNDPITSYIECRGENKNVIIRKAGQTIKTQLTLTKEEIISIIKSFSDIARVPLIEGMLTARKGNLEISAVVSESSSSSFIIKKSVNPQTRGSIAAYPSPSSQLRRL